ncbi:hypothetical protein LJC27_06085, partial [Christensenellaceae bacterium OttesenSCG-928-M15]|nr:hypothetical protein [Christensenellaceae bacterium OttesenSCG-928-M15]
MQYGRASKRRTAAIVMGALAVLMLIAIIVVLFFVDRGPDFSLPEPYEEAFQSFFKQVADENYDDLYSLLDERSKEAVTEEAFLERYNKIYSGIGAANMQVMWLETEDHMLEKDDRAKGAKTMRYHTSIDTSAGNVAFDNTMT